MKVIQMILVLLSLGIYLALTNAKTPCNVYQRGTILDCSSLNLHSPLSQGEWDAHDVLFPNLATANFSGNYIKYIYPFPELDLKVLDLSHNIIVQVDQNGFSKLRMIQSIDLSYNSIENNGFMQSRIENIVPVDTIAQRTLMNYNEDPDDNSIRLLEPSLFLRKLNLGHNKLSSLNPNAFEFSFNLTILWLDHNSFTVIDEDTDLAIRSLEKLEELYLNGNKLKTIPTYMLLNLMSLQILNLGYNRFVYIPSGLVGTRLTNFILDGNPIVRLSRENIFPVMTKLEVLSMCYMPELVEIGDSAFGNLKGLKALFMSYNPKFTRLSTNAFWRGIRANNIIKLDKLRLNNNSLSVIEEAMLDNWESLKELDLQYNDFVCSINTFLIEKLLPMIKVWMPNLVSGLVCQDTNGAIVHMDKLVQSPTESTQLKLESKGGFIRNNYYMTLMTVVLVIYFCYNI